MRARELSEVESHYLMIHFSQRLRINNDEAFRILSEACAVAIDRHIPGKEYETLLFVSYKAGIDKYDVFAVRAGYVEVLLPASEMLAMNRLIYQQQLNL
jgi:hypothetical protein